MTFEFFTVKQLQFAGEVDIFITL